MNVDFSQLDISTVLLNKAVFYVLPTSNILKSFCVFNSLKATSENKLSLHLVLVVLCSSKNDSIKIILIIPFSNTFERLRAKLVSDNTTYLECYKV